MKKVQELEPWVTQAQEDTIMGQENGIKLLQEKYRKDQLMLFAKTYLNEVTENEDGE